MSFKEALIILDIEDYYERIFNSSSNGEIFHIYEYIIFAESYKDDRGNITWFRKWFEEIVKIAEEKWGRPESVFQHIFTILQGQLSKIKQ